MRAATYCSQRIHPKVSSLLFGLTLLLSSSAWAQNAVRSANLFNPEISSNIALVGGYSSRDSQTRANALASGINIQELELRLGANADPFFRLDVSLAAHTHENTMDIGFEEAYLSTLALPSLTVRAGKFRVNFAKESLQHAHARRFIDAPLPLLHIFSSDHLLGTGVSLDYLAPLPFFTELNLQMVEAHWTASHDEDDTHAGHNHGSDSDDDTEAHRFSYIAHLKTFFEFSEATTIEFGASSMLNTDDMGDWRKTWGADLTLKWVPPGAARYTSLEWLTEYMSSELDGITTEGLYTGIRYQTSQRWWIQQRGALLDFTAKAKNQAYRSESLVAFAPSERTALRLQYGFEESLNYKGDTAKPQPVHEVFLQAIVSIGPHPAHAY